MSHVIGVMSYQGGGALHLNWLKKSGLSAKAVTKQEELLEVNTLILPGGESSVQYLYCVRNNLIEAITSFANSGKKIFATCAGAILLSHHQSPRVNGFALIDIDVIRNGYGSQINSGVKISEKGNKVTFIRAPILKTLSDTVKILDTYQNQPILVRQNNIMACSYHPECLNENDRQNNMILEFCS